MQDEIALLGSVIAVDHKRQAQRIAETHWRPIRNDIEVEIAVFVLLHILVDIAILRAIWLSGSLAPHDDVITGTLHIAAVAGLAALYGWYLVKHIWRQFSHDGQM